MLWLAASLGFLVVLVAVIAAIGATWPRDHVFAGSAYIGATPEAVWAVICDFGNQPAWHPLVTAATREPGYGGREVWRETSRGGPPMLLETVERVPARRLVRTIADTKAAFSGRWVFELESAEGGGTRLCLTEHGTVANPIFRFMVRVVGPGRYVNLYLKALSARFGGGGGGGGGGTAIR